MTLAELITIIQSDQFTKNDFPATKARFLNASFEDSLEDFFQDIAANFHGFANHDASFIWQSFVNLARKKILKHIDNKSLRLDPAMQENEQIAFFERWVNSIAIVYSLGSEASFENQQVFEQTILDQSFNPLVLFGAIKRTIPTTKQSECFLHVWNVLVLPSQSPAEDSQPSLMMQKFFEWSGENLPPEILKEMRSQHSSMQTYRNRSYYKATGEISLGIAAMKKKQDSALISALLQTSTHTAFVEKFKELSTNEISISDIEFENLVAMFKHMEVFRKQDGLNGFALPANIQDFLDKQNVDATLFTCLLPLCVSIDSSGLISYLSYRNQQEFFKQLADIINLAQATTLLNKIKTWYYIKDFDRQIQAVLCAYEAFYAKSETAFKDYLTAQCGYLLKTITIDNNSVQVTQQEFIARVRRLKPIALAFSIDNIQKLLETYWQFEPLNQAASPENNYFDCFTAFHAQISTSPVLQARMLADILQNVADEKIMANPKLCWFVALAAGQISLGSLSPDYFQKLYTLRNTSKNTPNSCLAPIFAYVEVHYTKVGVSLLREINHRRATNVSSIKESTTGKLLNAYKKPPTLITPAVAATQLFSMPEGTMDAVNSFWSGLTGAKSTSKLIVGNRSSMLGHITPSKGNAGESSSTVGLNFSNADNEGL